MSKLFGKYEIKKVDGSPTDPKAQYFVLRIDTDPAARAALLVYADQVKDSDPEFAKELQAWAWVYTENASNKSLKPTLGTARGPVLRLSDDDLDAISKI